MPLPINNFDNSKQTFFNLKGTYSLNRNWSFTGGYSYLKYTHNDIATDGFAYVLPRAPSNSRANWSSGCA